jgi:hypothetical protein
LQQPAAVAAAAAPAISRKEAPAARASLDFVFMAFPLVEKPTYTRRIIGPRATEALDSASAVDPLRTSDLVGILSR